MKNSIFILILIFSFFSCHDRSKSQKDSNIDFSVKNSINIEKNNIYKKYEIPLPIEIFQMINEDVIFNSNLLKPIENRNKEYTTPQSAYELGIYSADLAYCTLLENGQKTIDYSNVCGLFTNRLNIQDVYNRSYIDRLKNNINNHDSLIIITNKAYLKSCNLLDRRGMKNVIPFTIYGGWLESIHLALFSELKPNTDLDIYRKNIISKIKTDSLIRYLYDIQIETSAYYYNKDLKKIIFNLLQLEKLFNDYYKKDAKNYKEIENKIIELYKLNTRK